jgi:hypothetical protein
VTHLHEASEADAISANADRVAAELIQLLGEPKDYAHLCNMVSVAYLRGASDQLKRDRERLDKIGGAA